MSTLSIRARYLVVVGIAIVAILAISVASAVLSARVGDDLAQIEQLYLPRLKAGHELREHLTNTARGYQDAVAASDAEALKAVEKESTKFLSALDLHRGALEESGASLVRAQYVAYASSAEGVSRRMIAGETGVGIVDAIADMQEKHKRLRELIDETTQVDDQRVASAFSAAVSSRDVGQKLRLGIAASFLVLVAFLSVRMGRDSLRSLSSLMAGLERFGRGEFTQPIPVVTKDELGGVAEHANRMAEKLQRSSLERANADWLQNGQATLSTVLQGDHTPEEVGRAALTTLARFLDAPLAVIYAHQPPSSGQPASADTLVPLASFATVEQEPGQTPTPRRFRPGEGLVGQAALQQEVLWFRDLPDEYLRVRSGLGEARPTVVGVVPLVHGRRTVGVIELALFGELTERQSALLLAVRAPIAVALEVARAREETKALLAETQQQADRLATQEEELRAANEKLQTQQEELRAANEELTIQTTELESQRKHLIERNADLTDARKTLEKKAAELASMSAYKSQFLTNMSHELRTPLNSMLLLSNLLAEDALGNLTEKQSEYARTIHAAGKDLLALINQVLDLAKIESGKQEFHLATVPVEGVVHHMSQMFAPLAHDRGLAYRAEIAPDVPSSFTSDGRRVEQILINLLGNAIKFTEKGEVTLRVQRRARAGTESEAPGAGVLAFVVSDTGPGIAVEHQKRIFAPFEQAEGAVERRYGGTGLGLSIARELSVRLGGTLELQSVPGEGSTFICLIPETPPASLASPASGDGALQQNSPGETDGKSAAAPVTATEALGVRAGEPHLLIIEDDPVFASVFSDVALSVGLPCVIATTASEGLRMAAERRPSGIVLDVRLPDMDGYAVMERLQADPRTAAIPVHFVTALDDEAHGLALGAIGYLRKPATRQELVNVVRTLRPGRRDERPTNRILVVHTDPTLGEMLRAELFREGLEAVEVATPAQALQALQDGAFACLVVDLSVPDLDGFEFLQSVKDTCGERAPVVVVYTARPLSKEEVHRLEAYAESVVLREGPSSERLVNEIRLFVRRLRAGLAPRRPYSSAPAARAELRGKRILIVDDDMRTAYALSATLQAKGMSVLVADNGQVALDTLTVKAQEIDIVLMDIMMPVMDGYEAIQRIRATPTWRSLPIIALTAKAMRGEQEKCIAAGADRYIPKPIEAEQLLSSMAELVGKGDV